MGVGGTRWAGRRGTPPWVNKGGAGGTPAHPPTSPEWFCFDVPYTSLSDPSTQFSFLMYTLPMKAMIHEAKLKTTIQFGGPALATYLVSLGLAATNDLENFASRYNVMAAVTPTNMQQSLSGPSVVQNYTAGTGIYLTAYSTGANLDQANAGSVQVCLLISELP